MSMRKSPTQLEMLKKLKRLKSDPLLTLFDEIQEIRGELDDRVNRLEAELKKKEVLNEFEVQIDPEAIRGHKGDKGDRGEQGEQGERGERGEQGEQGLRGEQGEQGERGEKGDKGEAGKDGKDGSPDTPNQIIKKIHKSPLLIEQNKIKGLNDLLDNFFKHTTAKLNAMKRKKGGGASGGGGINIGNDAFTGDGSTTDFTLSDSTTTSKTLVFYNGETLKPTTHYTVSGTTLSLNATPLNGLAIWVWYIKS